MKTNGNDIELTWENAKYWQENANKKKEVFNEPKWEWDCNFKLDFDGSLISISSRFYPPSKQYGEDWDGNVCVRLIGETILKREFKCKTLDLLKEEVEKFTKHYIGVLKSRLI